MITMGDYIVCAIFVLICYSASLPLILFWLTLMIGWIYHRATCKHWRKQCLKTEPATEKKNNLIYLICPVRNITPEQQTIIDEYVKHLEIKGFEVHYPPRDVDQDDPTGMGICLAHAEAMERCGYVHIFWDGKSTGSHFDLGMAFMAHKPVYLVQSFTPDNEGKSYFKVIREMEKWDMADLENVCVP